MTPRWRIHAVLPRSRANGPGTRFTIWSQGCSLGCPGCFNPGTHDAGVSGQERDVSDLVDAALAERPAIEGVTVTGGEPLQQPGAVAAFCRQIRARSGLGIIVLTGFARREIEADPLRLEAVAAADLVVAGRYLARRHVAAGLRGSANKECWARTTRYGPADLAAVPELEIAVGTDGSLIVTGMVAPATPGSGTVFT